MFHLFRLVVRSLNLARLHCNMLIFRALIDLINKLLFELNDDYLLPTVTLEILRSTASISDSTLTIPEFSTARLDPRSSALLSDFF